MFDARVGKIPLEKGMAIHSSSLAWIAQRTEAPGVAGCVLQSTGLQSWTRLSDSHVHTGSRGFFAAWRKPEAPGVTPLPAGSQPMTDASRRMKVQGFCHQRGAAPRRGSHSRAPTGSGWGSHLACFPLSPLLPHLLRQPFWGRVLDKSQACESSSQVLLLGNLT